MQLQVKAHHASVPDSVRAYAEKRLSKLSRRAVREARSIEVTFSSRAQSVDSRRPRCRGWSCSSKGPNLVARESATTVRGGGRQARRQARAPDRALPRQAGASSRVGPRSARRDDARRRGSRGVGTHADRSRPRAGLRQASQGCSDSGRDAVATSEGDGTPGDEVAPSSRSRTGRFVLESGAASDPAPFGGGAPREHRASHRRRAVRRSDVWAVGAGGDRGRAGSIPIRAGRPRAQLERLRARADGRRPARRPVRARRRSNGSPRIG